MEIKITTFEQLIDVLNRIADTFIAKGAAIEVDLADYLKKTDAANTYVQKDGSKVLSTNDFTTAEKNKLAGIDANANNYTYTLPNATSNTIGGVKLYTGTGNNTDGTMTQAAIKTALSNVSVDLSGYLTKNDAANTYALKNQPVTLGTAAQTAEGAIWVQWS